MPYIDRPDIPAPILRALLDGAYSESLIAHREDLPDEVKNMPSISVTTLPRSPRQRMLEVRHFKDVQIDPVRDGFWKMLGHVVHSILERFAPSEDIKELRLGLTVTVAPGVKVYVHGQADLYSPKTGTLSDYKLTSAASMLYGEKIEHHAQLNVLAFIFRKHGHPVNKIENIFMFKDFDPRKVKEGSLYPTDPVFRLEVPMWTDEKILAYIKERASYHVLNEDKSDADLPFCSDTERWQGLPYYKVFKLAPEKETGVLARQLKSKYRSDSKLDATEWMQDEANAYPRIKIKGKNTEAPDLAKPFNLELVTVPGKPSRCGFCKYWNFCSQRLAELAIGHEEEEEEEEESSE